MKITFDEASGAQIAAAIHEAEWAMDILPGLDEAIKQLTTAFEMACKQAMRAADQIREELERQGYGHPA